jgi:serine/threonine protein phosphatase PrpC
MTQTQASARPAPENGSTTPGVLARPLSVESFGLTDPGRKRPTNQDQFAIATLMRALWIRQSSLPQATVRYADDRGHIFIVADGMGGVVGGEKASAHAVGAVEEFLLNALRWLLALDGSEEMSVLRDFKAALRSADACVYGAASNNPDLRGMGTTLTMAYSLDDELFVAHVGDSRSYLLRGGVLLQLTRDDTLVQQMVEGGLLKPENVADHQLRHVITNVVGGASAGIHVEVHRTHLEAGDVLLLCTDGLTGMLTDERIKAVLQSCPRPPEACAELARLANEQGGEDNITIVVARYAQA